MGLGRASSYLGRGETVAGLLEAPNAPVACRIWFVLYLGCTMGRGDYRRIEIEKNSNVLLGCKDWIMYRQN